MKWKEIYNLEHEDTAELYSCPYCACDMMESIIVFFDGSERYNLECSNPVCGLGGTGESFNDAWENAKHYSESNNRTVADLLEPYGF